MEKKKPFYQDVDGFRLPGAFSPEAFRQGLKYKPKPEDIFVNTFPKCGTTWTQHIIFLIFSGGVPLESFGEFMKRTPFLELCGPDAIEMMPRPGLIKLHLPYSLTPYSKEAKYVIVVRNPKDACISFYHHTKGFVFYDFADGNFNDFFEIFMDGKTDFGEYFDFTLSWYEHRKDPNVFFVTYEEMKMDIQKVILKLAKFLGDEWYTSLVENPNLVSDIVKHSSVKEMKKVMKWDGLEKLHQQSDQLSSGLEHLSKTVMEMNLEQKQFDFVRKGVIGDWKNYFSEEQAKQLDEKTKEKLEGTEIYDYWKSLGIFE